MLCPKCGSELGSDSAVCRGCEAATPAPETPLLAPAPAGGATLTPFSPPMFAMPNDLEGIGGWLILVAIGLVISPLYICGTSAKIFLPLLSNPGVPAFLQSHPAVRLLLLFEVATNAIFVLFLLSLNYLFFTKRRSFPTYFSIFLVTQLFLISADLVLAHILVPSTPVSAHGAATVARSLIGAAIWIPYMLISRRVKATFVR